MSLRQRTGLAIGLVVLLLLTCLGGVLLLRDPEVPLASGMSNERLAALARDLDREKLPYRIGEDGSSVNVVRSKLGKARSIAAGSGIGAPPSVGLEIFKETDFSTTDFAQKVNYQRALQGELTRTIQTLSGVRSARVHVILPDGGILRRNTTKATAAVEVVMAPGKTLGRSQVRGIQRLVTASVPDIRLDDVVVFDETGASLTRPASEGDADFSASLDMKRQIDSYLESKAARLLEEMVPEGSVTLSVDATLDYKQLRVTTDEPIAASGPKDAEHQTGVVAKERQTQRPGGTAAQSAGDQVGGDTSEWEYEYKVGHRVEQTLSSPGSIQRISVAAAVRGGADGLTSAAAEQLIIHGLGLEKSRGDSVVVMLLPSASQPAMASTAAVAMLPGPMLGPDQPLAAQVSAAGLMPWGVGMICFVLLAIVWRWMRKRVAHERPQDEPFDADAIATKVHGWLSQGTADVR